MKILVTGVAEYMKTIKEVFKKYTAFEKVVLIILLFAFLMQFFWICYINLFQTQYHLGYDTSSYFLKSIEIAKQGSLFIDHWHEQTTIYLDSPVPFVALLYKITGNIFVSYGIVNILMLVVLIGVYGRLASCFISRTGFIAKLVAVNMLIGAYCLMGANVVNDLEYSAMMYVAASMYVFKMLAFLLSLLCLIRLEEGKKFPYATYIISVLMLFVTGLSSGTYMLFTFVAPCIVYMATKILLTNNWKSIQYKSAIYLILCGFMIVAGKTCSSLFLGFSARDAGMTWCGYSDFLHNLGVFLMSYPQALTSMGYYSDIPIFSFNGICMMFGLGILFISVIALVYFIKKVFKEKGAEQNSLFLLIVIFVNAGIFIFGYTLMGIMPNQFQVRYLIPLMMLYFICTGIWIDHLNKCYLVSNLIMIVAVCSILGTDIKSDITYTTTRTNYDELKKLSEIIDKNTESPVVYVLGDSISARNLRVVDTDRVYKEVGEDGGFAHWGDYLYYDDPEEYPGEVIVLNRNNALQNLGAYYDACELLTTYNEYEIYKMKNNIIGKYCPIFETGQAYTFCGDVRTAEYAVTEGLSYNDDSFSWTDGNLKMRFYLKRTEFLQKNASVRFGLQGVWGEAQRVNVRINGEPVVNTKLDALSTVLQADFEIPENRIIELELVLPDASSPWKAGINEDTRNLGLRMVNMQVDLKP